MIGYLNRPCFLSSSTKSRQSNAGWVIKKCRGQIELRVTVFHRQRNASVRHMSTYRQLHSWSPRSVGTLDMEVLGIGFFMGAEFFGRQELDEDQGNTWKICHPGRRE